MPELPEVETVKEGLNRFLDSRPALTEIDFYRKDLRTPLPVRKRRSVYGQKVISLKRRAKYILIELESHYLLSHLGMTGSWRQGQPIDNNHDHLRLKFSDGTSLVYRDPRRFGIFDIISKTQLSTDKRLQSLGPEPFEFTGSELFKISRGRKTSIKSLVMDQRVVVGVGNIYACEALFMAGVSPGKAAGRLTQRHCVALVEEIKKVLSSAIRQGGTTISDYIQAEGDLGYFQNVLKVYGRSGQACTKCKKSIKVKPISGRSTYWCPICQK